jgi:nicotinamidase-related amidase
MDFQPAALGAVPDSEGVLARAGEALAWVRAHGTQVVFARVALAEADAAAVPAHNKSSPRSPRPVTSPTTPPGTAVHESLEIQEHDVTVRKIRSARSPATPISAPNCARNVDTLVLAGLSTSGVVLTTLRQAADESYRLLPLADATADPDPEVHQVLLARSSPARPRSSPPRTSPH